MGVDLGGTKIEGVALDAGGAEVARIRTPTPRQDYAATLGAVAAVVAELERMTGQLGHVGIGLPGSESLRTGLIKNANSTWLIGKPLKQDLESALRREVRIANDANCFALSEAVDGAGAGMKLVFGVILGTGVGAGIVVDQRLLVGANSICGEWGHNPLPNPQPADYPLPVCYCGRSGCVETYLSGPALARDYAKFTGRSLPPEFIAEGAKQGDPACIAALERYVERLGRALAVVVNILDPDVVVLGGGLSNIDYLYAQLPGRWKPHIFSDEVRTRLARNKFGDSSGVRGAAWLWNDTE